MEKRKVRGFNDMKLHNRRTIWELICANRPISRAQLAKMTKMSPTSISRLLVKLIELNLIDERPEPQTAIGRRATLIDIKSDAFFSIGIHVEVDVVQLCLLDMENIPRSLLERKIRGKQMKQQDFAEKAYAVYEEMLATTGILDEQVKVIGVSIAGIVDELNGITISSPQMHWKNVPTRDVVAQKFGKPTFLENDVKASVLEEYTRYDDFKVKSLAYLTLSVGIGSACMFNGKVLHGANSTAGEIEHVTMNPEGQPCSCGRRGCLYTLLSEKSLLQRIHKHSKSSNTIEKWIVARREGKAWAITVAKEFSTFLAMAINLLMRVYDPNIIIVGGTLISRQPEILEMAIEQENIIQEPLRSNIKVVLARSSGHESVIGAAIIAKNKYLTSLINDTDDNGKDSEK